MVSKLVSKLSNETDVKHILKDLSNVKNLVILSLIVLDDDLLAIAIEKEIINKVLNKIKTLSLN